MEKLNMNYIFVNVFGLGLGLDCFLSQSRNLPVSVSKFVSRLYYCLIPYTNEIVKVLNKSTREILKVRTISYD